MATALSSEPAGISSFNLPEADMITPLFSDRRPPSAGTAIVEARVSRLAVLGGETFVGANVVATDQRLGALRRVLTRLTSGGHFGVGGRDEHTTVGDLAGLDAGARHTELPRYAVAVSGALIAALLIDAAHLADGAIAIVGAVPLAPCLAHVVGAVTGDAALPGVAIERGLALDMTPAECTDQRRRTVGVDEASLIE